MSNRSNKSLKRTEQPTARNEQITNEIAERKGADEALSESSRRIENILDSITDQFYAMDREWRFTYINERALAYIQRAEGEKLTREALLGKNAWELYPELIGSVHYEKYHEAVREQKTVHFEVYCPANDTWGEMHAYPSEQGLSVYWQEITERKRAEEKLRRSEAYLAEAQSVSHTGSWAWNVSTGECFWSLEHFRIFGLDPNFKLTKETTQRFIHPEDLPFVEQTLERAVREKSDFEVEYRMVRPDGSIRFHRGLGHPVVKENRELEFIGTVVDVTERKEAEERLRRNEAYLAEAERLTHTGSWAWNVSTGELFWSLEHFRICGLDPETTNPSYPTALQCVHPEDRSFVQQTLEGALQDRSGFHVDCRIVRPDGAIVHIDSFARPVFDDAGEVTEYIGTIVDITERKRAEAALHKAQAELAQFSRVTLMGELVASIAHEINQPLGAIVNNCNVAMRLAELENGSFDKLVEVLSDIASDAIRASAIIEGIREMMKRSTPERTSLRLKDLVDDVLGLAARELAERRIAVRTELAEDMPRVSGDRVQLQQVLLNLVINSIEAMSDVDEETRILSIIAERDNLAGRPAVRLALQDSGIGFPAEECERIFDAFCTTKRHGMGMGLRISRSIVELHGGRLWAKSDHGQGAAFFLELPTDNEDV